MWQHYKDWYDSTLLQAERVTRRYTHNHLNRHIIFLMLFAIVTRIGIYEKSYLIVE